MALAGAAYADTVEIVANRDNTLYETTDGSLSNGVGARFLVGRTNQGGLDRRRGLVAFDLSAVPANATVESVTLSLYMSRTTDNAAGNVTLHKALAQWGEGTSNAGGQEGSGAESRTNDATWLHRLYPGTLWTSPGGDFTAAASATASVGTSYTTYTWTSAGMVADVQSWLTAPATNFGWLVRGDESRPHTARRFEARETNTVAQRPKLTITYSVSGPSGACCVPGSGCTVVSPTQCTTLGGTYQGNNTTCSPDPCPPPTGACCLPNASCVTVTAAQCTAQGGTYNGNGTLCDDADCPLVLTPFVDALPIPPIAQPTTGQPFAAAHYDIDVVEFMHQAHRDLPPTKVWGYDGHWPGPTIAARRGQPVTVTWRNELRDISTGEYRTSHVLPVDTCLHGPDMMTNHASIVTHLHGGVVPPSSDGYPEFYFGPGESSPLYTYPNDQPAALVWYHDHALGITRLNVYMGMAGGYLIRDSEEEALNLPSGEYEIPLVIQDRSFEPDGSLDYHDMWMDHFFGDFMVVNGKVMPYLNVKQGKYRFRVAEGCNSRTLTLSLSNGASFQVIGSDTGILPAPATMSSITLSPGERSDIIMDFAGYAAGTEIILTNSAPAPYPGTPGVGVLPTIMKFIVQGQPGHTATIPATLIPVPPLDPADAVIERTLNLRRSPTPDCGHDTGMWMIDDLAWHDITEFPYLNDVEIWTWRNRSGMVHPMHMHLVKFQVLNRQAFDAITGLPTGPVIPPRPEESGWKDTVQAMPGQLTRVITRFEGYTGKYPYHCHVLEHEDHEMMRQFQVILPCGTSDFNGDGDFGTDADIEAFFACLGGNCCPTCYPGGSDFNQDGDYGTDGDIESFFRVLGGGNC
jgi:spore coat protein A